MYKFNKNENLLYCDADGVLADFDMGFASLFGMNPRTFEDMYGESTFWDKIKEADDFFYNLPPMQDAMVLWDAIKDLHPIIITGCPVGGWAEVQKHRWIRKYFGRRANVITCASRDKSLFCHRGDVIIDDWERHKPKWEAKGGIWVLHTSAEDSIRQLIEIGVIQDPDFNKAYLEEGYKHCPHCNGSGVAGERDSCMMCDDNGLIPLVSD